MMKSVKTAITYSKEVFIDLHSNTLWITGKNRLMKKALLHDEAGLCISYYISISISPEVILNTFPSGSCLATFPEISVVVMNN